MHCILMSDAATVPSFMMMISIVSEESLARTDRQTDRQTHTHTHTLTHTIHTHELVYVNFFKVLKLWGKKCVCFLNTGGQCL